jgi:SPX domain protein involved in polyphosphate accumulation
MHKNREEPEFLRYERKYLITDYSFEDVRQLLKFHPACFSEIYHKRKINNIYFDTPSLDNYYDNQDGNSNRKKVRIRWYGELFGSISEPVLEYKIKKGLLGYKRSFPLHSFYFGPASFKEQLKQSFEGSQVPLDIKNEVLSLNPTLLNQYTRRYFLSADKKFRVTIDHDLIYYGINAQKNVFVNRSFDHSSTVLELKYNLEDETEADTISTHFPFMLTKNSKYLTGLERTFF